VEGRSCAGMTKISKRERHVNFFIPVHGHWNSLIHSFWSSLGINTRWRGALLAAAHNLRQSVLRGCILGNEASDQEQGQEQEPEEQMGQGDAPFCATLYTSESSSLDLPLASEHADADSKHRRSRPMRVDVNVKGRVRGMVNKWEHESARNRSSSRSSSCSRRRCGSESDNGSGLGEREMMEDVGGGGTSNHSRAAAATAAEEPSIEDLLVAEGASPAPKDSSWGARAWEELDIGETMRRIEAHDTAVPRRRDGSRSSGASAGHSRNFLTRSKRGGRGGSSKHVQEVSNEDAQSARRTIADIFADPGDTVPTPAQADAEIQADTYADAGAWTVDLEKERVLEDEVRGTRSLLEEFKRRLEVVEERVGAMEAEWYATEERLGQAQVQQQGSPQRTSVTEDRHDKAVETVPGVEEERLSATKECATDAYAAVNHLARRVVDLTPTTVSELPSYVLLVGFGVCAVVLQVVLKQVTRCRTY
jgi:hypothetical protein